MNLTDLQLDALREMSNIGSGNAATALASMLGQSVDLHVPTALALELADAVDAVGNPEDTVSAVIIGVFGDLDATVLLLFDPESANTLCSLLGVEGDPEMALSALGEIGNILGSSYVQAMGTMTSLHMEPHPPVAMSDMLGAIVASVLAVDGGRHRPGAPARLEDDGRRHGLQVRLPVRPERRRRGAPPRPPRTRRGCVRDVSPSLHRTTEA